MNKYLIIALIAVMLGMPCSAKHTYLEKDYRKKWCTDNKGQSEVRLGSSRVDCETEQYAVEVEFAHKFYEAIGQSEVYSIKLNKQPAILLILETKDDERYLEDLNLVANKLGIKIFLIRPEDL